MQNLILKASSMDFPGGPVVKNLPANPGDTGLIPGLGRFDIPWGNYPRSSTGSQDSPGNNPSSSTSSQARGCSGLGEPRQALPSFLRSRPGRSRLRECGSPSPGVSVSHPPSSPSPGVSVSPSILPIPGGTHSSTRGLRPPEQLERPAGFPSSYKTPRGEHRQNTL